jgi:hypothetical protein
LVKVSVLSARVVIVLGCGGDPEASDCVVTSVVLAVQALASARDPDHSDADADSDPEAAAAADLDLAAGATTVAGFASRSSFTPLTPSASGLSVAHAPVIAELALPESAAVLEALGGSSVFGVAAAPLVDNLLVLAAVSPAVGLLLAELLSFQAPCEFKIVPAPAPLLPPTPRARATFPFGAGAPAAVFPADPTVSTETGEDLLRFSFGAARRAMSDAVALAVLPAEGPIVFAPPDARRLEPSDQLLVLEPSLGWGDASDYARADDSAELPPPPTKAAARRRAPPAGHEAAGYGRLRGDVRRVQGAGLPYAAAWAVAAQHEFDRAPGLGGAEPQVVAVLGWRPGPAMCLLLRALDDRSSAAGCTAHVLSNRPLAARAADLASGEFVVRRLVLVHHVGEASRRASLAQLPLQDLTAVIITDDVRPGPAAGSGDNENNAAGTNGGGGGSSSSSQHAEVADARVLTAAVQLSQLLDERATALDRARGWSRCQSIGLLRSSFRPPLACQFLDGQTQRILAAQPHLHQHLESLVPVHRSALEMGVLALAATDPKMVALLAQLLVKRPSDRSAPSPFAVEPALECALEHVASLASLAATGASSPSSGSSGSNSSNTTTTTTTTTAAIATVKGSSSNSIGSSNGDRSCINGSGSAGGSSACVLVEEAAGAAAPQAAPLQAAASFWELDARLRLKGRLLLGWHRVGRPKHCLNPQRKAAQLLWRSGDILLVALDPLLREGGLRARAAALARHKSGKNLAVSPASMEATVVAAQTAGVG